MMNRQIRVKKIIGTVKCVVTCGAIKILPSKRETHLIIEYTYLAGVTAYTALCYVSAAVKLAKHKH